MVSQFHIYLAAKTLFGVLAIVYAGVNVVINGLPAGRAVNLHVNREELNFPAAFRTFLYRDRRRPDAGRSRAFKQHRHPYIIGVQTGGHYDLCHVFPSISEALQKFIDGPGSEVQRFYGDTLISSMKQLVAFNIGGQLHRCEPIGLNSQF